MCAWAVDGATNRPTAHRGLSAAPFEGRFPWPKDAALTDFIAPSVAAGSARYRVGCGACLDVAGVAVLARASYHVQGCAP